MRSLSAVAQLLVALPIAPAAAAAPVTSSDPCFGRWQGRGQNTGMPEHWTIDLTLYENPDGGRCATIEYDNPKCGGTLESCQRRGDEIHTVERYTHSDGCAPPGKVILRCDGDRMRYSWLGWERVDSTLTRVGEAPAAPAASVAEPKPAPPRADEEEEEAHEPAGCLPSCAIGASPGAPLLSWLVLAAVVAGRRLTKRSRACGCDRG